MTPEKICNKWVSRFGLGFHPDTRGKDYSPPLSQAEVNDYDADMEVLFAAAMDPYGVALTAMDNWAALAQGFLWRK